MPMGCRGAEVVVAGGGVAGFCAAVAAARAGADTLLVDRNGFLGGMFTGGNMTVLNCPPAGGIGKEIVDALTREGAARRCPDDPPNYPILHYASEYCTMNVAYDAELAKILLFRIAKEAGVRLLLHSFITGAVVDRGAVKGVTVANKSGAQVATGKVVVDATADGDVAADAGAAFRKGQTEKGILFAMTLLVRLSHVDWPSLSAYSRTDPGLDRAIQAGIARGDLPFYKPRTRDMVNYWGHARPELSHLLHEDEALLWGGTVEGVDGTNVDDLSRAEAEAREQLLSELTFLRQRVPGFKGARIESSGTSIGVRDTRHVIGTATLAGEDILSRRTFPDGVAYNVKAGFPANEIPYGCLVPQTIDGLVMTGNCISVIPGSTEMGFQLGSFNNLKDIPSMWTIGEASGVTAALSSQRGLQPRALDPAAVRHRLLECGALLAPERIRELEQAAMPSGRAAREYYAAVLADMTAHWKRMGALQ